MRVAVLSLVAALAVLCLGVALTLAGIRIATTHPRPRDLGGMLLAAAGLALALGGMFAAVTSLGR
jgi:hypothetical protein